MPELPEVETIVRQLKARGVEGRTVLDVQVHWPRTVEPLSPEEFSAQLRGCRIESLSRTGKWMLFTLDSGMIWMVHLRMSGSFSTMPGSHDRAVVTLTDGLTLFFRDTRKFGRWKLSENPEHILKLLGPDALSPEFTCAYLRDELRRRKRLIKPLLLDQAVVAGLGNIYADEALWLAHIHPMRRSNDLSNDEIDSLYRAVQEVLKIGIRNRGTSLGGGKTNYRDFEGKSGAHREKVKAYGRSGKPCKRCGNPLEKAVVAQRTSTFCPTCQRL